jgi:hypothetical protein
MSFYLGLSIGTTLGLVVWEGLDERGSELIHGLQDWIKWISEVGGKGAV